MKKISLAFLKNEDLHRILIFVFAVAATFLAVIAIYPYNKYNYKEYDIARKDIKAPFDIENTFETEKNALRNKQNAPLVIIDNKENAVRSTELANTFFSFIYDLRRFHISKSQSGGETYKRTLAEFRSWMDEFEIVITDKQIDYLVSDIDEDEYIRFFSVTFDIVSSVMINDIMKSALSDNIILAQNSYRQKGLGQETVLVGQNFISAVIFPNREIDEALSEQIRDKEYYMTLQTESVVISKGDVIVRKGTAISPEKFMLLDHTGLIRAKGIEGYLPELMIFLYIAGLYIFVLIYLKSFYKKAYKGRKEELLLLLIILIVLALSLSAARIDPLLIPLYMVPMMVAILLELKLAIVINIMLTFVIAIFVPGIELLFTFFLGGTFAAMLVQNKKQRSRLSLYGMFAALISSAIYVIARYMVSADILDSLSKSVYVLISGIFSIVFTVGLLPLFEIIFNITTPGKLLELSNPNQPLLKKLLMEAPGTYHHSLMVGNLAEEATGKIGGNSLLARVGSYYHDVGKVLRPLYFTENQKAENPHDEMNPKLSSFVVVSHVSDGVKLAREYKLPPSIISFIRTHHGDTLTSYFYYKAKEKETEKNSKVSDSDYRYPGPRPETKEGAVVMLADSVEAAVKSLDEKTEEKIAGFIRKIIKSKLDEGQLDKCDLTLKDLDLIAASFSHVLGGYYHNRIAYPDVPAKEEQ